MFNKKENQGSNKKIDEKQLCVGRKQRYEILVAGDF